MSRGERHFGLDLLRALAVLMVLVGHGAHFLMSLWPALNTYVLLAYWGVELFFVLSGFLIGGLLLDAASLGRRGWLLHFWVRRGMRTLPNFYLFLLVNLLIFRAVQGEWPQAWAFVVFVQNLAWPHPAFFGEAWSLAIEEIFYLMAPLLTLALMPLARNRATTLALIASGILAASLLRLGWVLLQDPLWDEGVRKISLLRLDAIAWGVLTVYWCRRWPVGAVLRNRLACAGLALTLASAATWYLLEVDQSLFARTALFSLTSLAFAMLLPWAERFAASDWPAVLRAAVVRIAVWSYSIYLVHLVVVRLMEASGHGATRTLDDGARFVVYVGVTMLVAALVYRYFERPLLLSRERVARFLLRSSPPEVVRAGVVERQTRSPATGR